MKDFRLDRKADPKYILDVKPVKNRPTAEGEEARETLTITFADGRKFDNIEYSAENIQTIIAQQERQARAGVKNLPVFQGRKTIAGVMTAASIVGGPVIGAVTSTAIDNPIALAIGTGVVTLAALIPSACSLVKNAGKVKELRKIKFRDVHRKELETYPNYENALAGLPTRKRQWFEGMANEGQDPFCITEIDSYTQRDLEQIMENMETEKQYTFKYAPRKTASSK
ncbi:MAG: hypothetical protein IJE53_07190 [Bacilli bacterium]|nr:hypothetical protein [Bacilli bacterium]